MTETKFIGNVAGVNVVANLENNNIVLEADFWNRTSHQVTYLSFTINQAGELVELMNEAVDELAKER